MTDPRNLDDLSCPECGGDLFQAIPGQTTEQDILEFQKDVERRQGISAVDAGWIHPGTYCYDCDYGILVEYALPFRAPDDRPGALILEKPGPEPLKVAVAIKNSLGMTPTKALERVRSAPVTLRRGSMDDLAWRFERLLKAIANAGGSVRIEPVDEAADSDEI